MAHEGVPVRLPHGEAQPVGGVAVGLGPVYAVHLAQRVAVEELIVALEHAELPRGEPPQVLHRRNEARRRADAAHPVVGDHMALAVAAPRGVPRRQPVAAEAVLQVGEGAGHPQRVEDVGAHVVVVALAGRLGDDLARERQRQIRVLEVRPRGVEHRLRGQRLDDLLVGREGVVGAGPVGHAGLARQPGAVRQQPLDVDRTRLRVVVLDVEPVQVLRDGVVQRKLALVAQLQRADGGEELGDGADRIHRRRGGGLPALHVRVSISLRPHELLVVHHGERGAGDAPVGLRRVHPDIQQMKGLGDAGVVRERLLGVRRGREEQEQREHGGGGVAGPGVSHRLHPPPRDTAELA